MRLRTFLGAAMIGGIALLAFLDDRLFGNRPLISLSLLLLALAGWAEYARMTGISHPPKGSRSLHFLGMATITYYFVLAWMAGNVDLPGGEGAWTLGGIFLLVFGAFAAVVLRKEFESRYPALLETVLGVLLLGYFLSYLVRIYRLPGAEGPVLWAVLMLGVKGNDMAAYYVGKTWGRHHPFPVSPRKTREGSIGAILFSVAYFGVAGWALGRAFPGSPFQWSGGMLFGVIISIASQIGDLGESLIKRVYQVKDSSRLLPEFGGILDLVDSLIFTGFLGFLFWGHR